MNKRTTSFDRSGNPACRALYVALAGAMLLSGGWGTPTTAMAATCSGDKCGDKVRGLKSHILAVNGPTVRIVDLGVAETPDERIAPGTTAESVAPLLYLTPRVASILEDVFDDATLDSALPAQDAPEKADESAIDTSGQSDRSASPVADTPNRNTGEDPYGPLTVLDGDADLPKFQRQMYRTDI